VQGLAADVAQNDAVGGDHHAQVTVNIPDAVAEVTGRNVADGQGADARFAG
jgi:hypothetical protein